MNRRDVSLINEFSRKHNLYEEFSQKICRLLAGLLKERKYKHHIFCRTKSIKRLREKIIRKRKEGRIYKNLPDIEDLSGVRVVFYLESDKRKFIKDLKKEIKSIRAEKKAGAWGYRADHLILSLDQARLKLGEYKRFKRLKCEIQLASIINHAWAEIEHDWLYKDVRGFKNKNPAKYAFLRQKMEYVFNNYIKKTGIEFEKIAKKIQRYYMS